MKLEMRYIVPVLYSGMYFVLAGLVIALAVLSFREDVPAYARDPPCFIPLRKMAVFLYRKLLEYREKRRRKGKELLIPAIPDCILEVEPEAGTMKVHLLPGLE